MVGNIYRIYIKQTEDRPSHPLIIVFSSKEHPDQSSLSSPPQKNGLLVRLYLSHQ